MDLPPLPEGRCGVFHMEPHDKLPPALLKHIVGEKRPITSREVERAVYNLASNVPLAKATIKACMKRQRRGRPPKHVLALMFAGPPHYEGPHKWKWEIEKAWVDRVMRFLNLIAGDHSVIVSADLHRDETAPHIHVLLVPVSNDGRLGWTRVQEEAMVRLGAGKEGQVFKYGQVYGSMQDAYYDHVSRHFGLGRGEEGSEAEHKRPDRIKAQAIKEGYAEDRRKRAEADLEETREAVADEVADAELKRATFEAEADAAARRREQEQAGRQADLEEARALVQRGEEAKVVIEAGGLFGAKRRGQERLDEADAKVAQADNKAQAAAEKARTERERADGFETVVKELEAAVDEQEGLRKEAEDATKAVQTKLEKTQKKLKAVTNEKDGLVRSQQSMKRVDYDALKRAREGALKGHEDDVEQHGRWMFLAGAEQARQLLAAEVIEAMRGRPMLDELRVVIDAARGVTPQSVVRGLLSFRNQLLNRPDPAPEPKAGPDRGRD